METFKIIGLNTGRLRGTVKGIDYQEAENKCLEKGIDMYDEYTLVHEKEEVYPASPFIDEILNL